MTPRTHAASSTPVALLTRRPCRSSSLHVSVDTYSTFDLAAPPVSSNFAGRVQLRWSVRALALASAYLLVAEAGLRYASIGVSVSPVWPPTGLAIAALLFMGLGYWPAIFVGALLANVTTPIPLLAAIGIACGNTAEAVLAVYILRARNAGDVAIDDPAW